MLVNSSLASKESRNKLEQRLKNLKWACCQQGLAAQLAFNILLAHGILQFAVLIALRCALHRYLNQDIHRWKLLERKEINSSCVSCVVRGVASTRGSCRRIPNATQRSATRMYESRLTH